MDAPATPPTAPRSDRPPRVLLLHHAAGGAADWDDLLPPLAAAGLRVQAPELPGHGDEPGEPLASLPEMAHWIRHRCRLDPADPALLVGHSMGGALALLLAAQVPAAVAGLLIVSCAARLRVPRGLFFLVRERYHDIGQLLLAVGGSVPPAPARLRALPGGPFPAGRDAALADFRACDAFDLRGRIPALGVPTVVMVGDDDKVTPPRAVRELADALPGAAFRRLPAAGHMLIWDRPADLVDEILALADRAARPPGPPSEVSP